MRAYTAIVLLALVFSANAVSRTATVIHTFNSLIQKKTNAKIAQNEASTHHNKKQMNVLKEMQSFLQTGGPAKKLNKIFQGLLSNINDEQFRADNVYVLQRNECDDEIAFRTSEVSDAQTALDVATEIKNKAEATLARAQAVLELNIQLQDEKTRQLENEAKARNNQHDFYTETINAIQEAIRIIQGALELNRELENDVGVLVQLRKVSAKMIITGVKANRLHLYTPVVAAFAALSSHGVNAADVARVNELLNRLLDNLNEELQNTDETENRDVAEYQAFVAALNHALAELRAQEAATKTLANDCTATITQESAIIGDATAKRERNQNLLDRANAMCEGFEAEYHVGNNARKKEKALIEKFLSLIQEYFRGEL
jgi:hypothetical protein